MIVYPIISGLIGIPPECPWITRRSHKDFLLSKQSSTLFLLLPCDSDEATDCQKMFLLLSAQTPSATPISRSPNGMIRLVRVRHDRFNDNPFPFNYSLFEQRITNKIAEMVRTSSLVAFRSVSFLNASGSFFNTIPFKAVSNSLLDLSSFLWSRISSTKRSVSLEITT